MGSESQRTVQPKIYLSTFYFQYSFVAWFLVFFLPSVRYTEAGLHGQVMLKEQKN